MNDHNEQQRSGAADMYRTDSGPQHDPAVQSDATLNDNEAQQEFKEESRPPIEAISSSSTLTADNRSPTTDDELRMEATKSQPDDNKDDDLELDRKSTLCEGQPLWRELLMVGVICMAQFTTQLALGQVMTPLYIIGEHFGIADQPGKLSWLIAGYSLTVGSFILIAGRFGDVFGYKRMLVIGFAWNALWSLICGVAYYDNVVLFIFARVLQGIGPSICLPNGLALLGATYPAGKKKNMVFAVFGATAPIGAVFGLVFGALFSQVAGFWPWTFFSFAIAMMCLAIASSLLIPHMDVPENIAQMSLKQKIRELDLPGGAIGITALILINFAWNQSGVATWHQAYVYVCLIIGVLLLPVFFYYEQHIAPQPLLPFDIFTVDIAFVLALIALGWGSFGIFYYYSINFLLVIRQLEPMLVAAQFTPVAASGCCAAIITGLLLSKLRPAWVMTFALSAFLTGNLLIGTAPVHQTYWAQTFVCFLVVTFGMDMSFPAGTVIISNSLPKNRQGMGASLVNTVVNYSIALALGFAGTVEGQVADGNTLRGYRGAFYMAYGLAGSGLVLSCVFLIRSYIISSRNGNKDGRGSEKA